MDILNGRTDIEYKSFPWEVEVKGDGTDGIGIFKGFASTFGGDGDAAGDVIAFGAFKDTIAKGGRNGDGIPILWQHDPKTPIGKIVSINENSKGLAVEGEIVTDTTAGSDAYKLLRRKVIKHMSIGYDPVDFEPIKRSKGRSGRLLKSIDLWEISTVTFPMNLGARITTVKTAIKNALTERELEHALREAGLSKSDSLYVVSLARPALREAKEADSEVEQIKIMSALADEFAQFNGILRGGY